MHQWLGKAIIAAKCLMVVTISTLCVRRGGQGGADGGKLLATEASSGMRLEAFWLPLEENMRSDAQ